MKFYDVVVIGGGPVGSQVAYKLAGMGYGVVVVEQKEELGKPVCCTGIISQECVRSFAIDDDVVLRPANSAQLFSPSGELLRLWREDTQAYIVDRAAFNMAMFNRAQDKGAEYALNSPVRDIEVKDDRVRVRISRQGEELSLEARAAVIATGLGSRLVEKMGLGKVSDLAMGAQAKVETTDVNEVEVYFGQGTAPGFFAWLVPTSPRVALAGLLSRHSPKLYMQKLLSSLLAQGKIVSDEVDPIYGRIQLKPLAKTYRKRIVVVGGAAGQVKATTGGGIYYGLLCAEMAANNLHQALASDDLSARSLASYEREWKKKLGRELNIDYYARKFYERLSDRQIDRIFGVIKSHSIHETLLKADDLSFDWHSEAVLRLMAHRAMSKTMKAMKIPFRIGGN